MIEPSSWSYRPFAAVTVRNLPTRPEWQRIPASLREVIRLSAQVLPFRANDYVLRELIDWSKLPEDPIFQLVFPQPGMLSSGDLETLRRCEQKGVPASETRALVTAIRLSMNPQPSDQIELNVPLLDGRRLRGLQHKYRETILFFPAQGQICHAYCTFCFRWAQFVDLPELKFEARETDDLTGYLRQHREVTDVLYTGGDPMVMASHVLERYLGPLLVPELAHVTNIRIGTKVLSYWPQRFVTDHDADELLRLFERIVASGRHLALMAHYNHPVELSTPISREAIRRVRSTGAEVRMQSPIVRHINDDGALWAEMWSTGVRLGMIPYYAFIERDTGPKHYFELPIVQVYEIFRTAYSKISGLARSVRGPVMSASAGKVRILGRTAIDGRELLVLDFLQARDPELVRRPFFAQFDPHATWFDQLKPAFDSDAPFFALDPVTQVAVG
jgi:L-lysine 2,3-aminomutase